MKKETQSIKQTAMCNAVELIKGFEGLSLKAYRCQAGVWTIGYGNTSYLKSVTNNKPQSQILQGRDRLEALRDKLRGQSINLSSSAVSQQSVAQQFITRQKAEELLTEDVDIFFESVWKDFDKICNQNQIAALTSFAYNCGLGGFRSSGLYKIIKLNPNNYSAILTEFLRWVNAGGKLSTGLKNRRMAEFNFYKKPCSSF
jgi:lysozyme